MKIRFIKNFILTSITSVFFISCLGPASNRSLDISKIDGRYYIDGTVNGMTVPYLLDTGYAYSSMYSSYIKDHYGSFDNAIAKSKETNNVRYIGNQKCYFVPETICFDNDQKYEASLLSRYEENVINEPVILGSDFFTSYESVTLDFRNNKLILNDKPICNKAIDLQLDYYTKLLSIPVIIDDKEVNAIIDTGFLGGCLMMLVPTTTTKKCIDNLMISDQKYNQVNCYDAFNEYVLLGEQERIYLSENYLLPIDFFYDKVIQFDFRDMVFRIK